MHIIVNIDNTIADLKPISGGYIPADLPEDIYFRHSKNLMFRIKPYPGAVETLQYISEYMDIIYTTARPTEIAFITVRWLEINNFPSGQILFLPPNKDTFQTQQVSLMTIHGSQNSIKAKKAKSTSRPSLITSKSGGIGLNRGKNY